LQALSLDRIFNKSEVNSQAISAAAMFVGDRTTASPSLAGAAAVWLTVVANDVSNLMT